MPAKNMNRIFNAVVRAMSALAAVVFLASSCGNDSPAQPDPDPVPEPELQAYMIEVADVTTWTAGISVTPQKEDAKYYMGAVSRHEYDSLGSDAALVEMEIGKIHDVADLYEVDYASYAGKKSISGRHSITVDGLLSDTDYYAFAFTFSDDFTFGSDLVKCSFHTQKVQKVNCTFSIEVGNVTKGGADISVTPSDGGCYYFWDYLTASEYKKYGGDAGIAEVNVSLIRRAVEIYQMAGYDKSFADFLNKGKASQSASGLVGGTDYVVFAFGVDPSGVITTDLATKAFRTEEPEPSALTFKTELFELKFNGAKIGFTPSNDNETYFTDCMDYETFSKFGSDKEVIEWVLSEAGSSISSFLAQGYHVVDASDMLASETRYVAYAFGYDKGATTGLTTVEFTTPAMPTGSGVSVKIEYEIVDAGTISPAYEGKTALSVSLTPSVAAEHWYAAMFRSLDGYDDNSIIEALQARGYKDKEKLAFLIEPGETYILAAVAVDPSGRAGALNRVDGIKAPGTSQFLAQRSLQKQQPLQPLPALE